MKYLFQITASVTNLFGFQSSSQISIPTHVSSVDKTTSPNGTVVFNKPTSQNNYQHLNDKYINADLFYLHQWKRHNFDSNNM